MPYSKEKAKAIAILVDTFGVEETAEKMGVGVETVTRAVRKHKQESDLREFVLPKSAAKKDEGPVLIIPDLHAPYHHPQTIEFLKAVHKARGCRPRVVATGDIADFHSMSRHVHETDAWSPAREYQKLLEFTAELEEAFPEGDWVLGNHDLIPQRQMKELGLVGAMLKSPNELYGVGEGWTLHPLFHVIDPDGWDVLVEHGIGSGGKYGCANTAKEKRCSYVQGHIHSAAAVIYSSNHENTIFGMNVGCLVDADSLAMRYGKYATRKGVMGCGVVYSGGHAEFVPMSSWEQGLL